MDEFTEAFFGGFLTKKKIDPIFQGARNTQRSNLVSNRESVTRLRYSEPKGTEYVKRYLQEEEMSLNRQKMGANYHDMRMEEVSVTTEATQQLEEVEDIKKLYQTYQFVCQPKMNLTINSVRGEILDKIQTNPVCIIQGKTGCGKTTQVPQFILQSCIEKGQICNIIVTQPRRIAAISIAKRVCEERDWPLGSMVGFKVGLANSTSKETRLTYCTTGVLLQKLIMTRHMNEYTHIIVDEIHERDQDLDFLLLVIRKFLRTNSPSVRIILMSATADTAKFANYFSSFVGNKMVPSEIIEVGKSHYYVIKEFYLDDLRTLGKAPMVALDKPRVTEEMLKYTIELLKAINKMDQKSVTNLDEIDRHSVLIFLPGIYDIEELYNMLLDPSQDKYKWSVLMLHSLLTRDEQEKIFKPPEVGYRRIILSTNIAESSLTVPNVKYIIDFCLTKQMVKNPSTNYQSLELAWTSQASCKQRSGRTGRVMDGRVYRLIPKKFFESLPKENVPEILQAPLEIAVLRSKMLSLGEPKAILALAIDPPRLDHLERSIIMLKEIGGLINNSDLLFDGQLTDLGKIMTNIPVDVHVTKMIMLGHAFSVLREAIIIGASMSVKNMFSIPFHDKLNGYKAKLTWSKDLYSDGIAFLNAYNQWKMDKASGKIKGNLEEKVWGKKHFLQIRIMREIDALVKEITQRLQNYGIIGVTSCNRVKWDPYEKDLAIKVVMAGAFYPNYYLTNRKFKSETNIGKKAFDPCKTIYLTGWPLDQPGILYANKFISEFDKCLSSNCEVINVDFDSSRVIVTFDRDNSKQGKKVIESFNKIPLSVYKALKLKQIKEKIQIPTINIGKLYEKNSELIPNVAESNSALYSSVALKNVKPMLPRLDVSTVEVQVKFIENPGHFWVFINDEANLFNYNLIHQFMEKLNPNNLDKITEVPAIGNLVVAKNPREPGEKLSRAVVKRTVKRTSETHVEVFFIDFGNTEHIPDLYQLPMNNNVQKTPALVVECKLAQVKPAGDVWSDDAKSDFANLVQDVEKLFAEVYSVTGAVMNVNLILELDNQKKCVNNKLVQVGYAVSKEESKLSKKNHNYRKRVNELSPNEVVYIEEMQYFSFDLEEKLVTSDCKMTVLNGPYSPLEVNINCLLNAGIGKKVTIAEDSVNSILLEPNPEEDYYRFIVAGIVTESPLTKNLNIRNTTLMPKIPGLVSLMALIFAPQIELRCNSRRTQLTGALCGLGYDRTNNQSLFPEHDMSIVFDYKITTDDLININKLRHWMSGIIQIGNPDEPQDGIINTQHKIKDCFDKIMLKKRDKIVPETDSKCNFWGRYSESMFMVPEIPEIKHNIYKLHDDLDLTERDDEKEALIYNEAELREIATMSYKTEISNVFCKLCQIKIDDVLEVRTHISSPSHRIKVQAL